MDLKPAFPGQPVWSTIVELDPTILTTTVTTGVVASSIALITSGISNFATRFAAFDEYRVVKIRFQFSCLAPTATGIMTHWVEEKVATAPSAAIALAATKVQYPMSDVFGKHELIWTPHDVGDLDYTQVGTVKNLCYLDSYTSVAAYGAPAVATSVVLVQAFLTIQFRGYA